MHAVSGFSPVLLPVQQLFHNTADGSLLLYPVHHPAVFQHPVHGFPFFSVPARPFFLPVQVPSAYLPVPETNNYGHGSFLYERLPDPALISGASVHKPCILFGEVPEDGYIFLQIPVL